MESHATFTLTPRGPFSIEPVRTLACGFLRGARACSPDELVLAFPLDGTFQATAVRLRWDGTTLHGEVFGAHAEGTHALSGACGPRVIEERAANQVARALAIDVDATPFAAVLEADPVLRRIARRRPGFRPPVAFSPYVMAGWSVLSQRTRMSQAAALQVRIAEAAGDVLEVGEGHVAAFPSPESVLRVAPVAGLSAEKWERLRAVARAALDGQLERDALLALPEAEARERLMRIRGIGPWAADAILVRGCGPVDVLPLRERTLHGAVALAYGLPRPPSDAELLAIAERWRPFRTWVSVLLVSDRFEEARRLVA